MVIVLVDGAVVGLVLGRVSVLLDGASLEEALLVLVLTDARVEGFVSTLVLLVSSVDASNFLELPRFVVEAAAVLLWPDTCEVSPDEDKDAIFCL